MNLRTPRRRISPRTKRRYQAIKNFLQRALGSSSQPNIIKKSSFVSVFDLKQKIAGIEHQLNTVSKHCQELASLEYNLRPNTISTEITKDQNNVESDRGTYTKTLEEPETKVLYKTSQNKYQHPRPTSKETYINNDDIIPRPETEMKDESKAFYKKKRHKHGRLEPIQEGEQIFRKHRHRPVIENDFCGHTRSYNSLHDEKSVPQDVRYSERHHHRKKNKKTYETNECFTKEYNHNSVEEKIISHKNKNFRNKYIRPELDEDFIAEIIRRQYRPDKLFDRKESNLTQFSAPVCRDQEFPIHDTAQKGSKWCSYCHEKHRRQKHSSYMCYNDLSDMRSICDTRLYSSRKQKHKINHRKLLEEYNDSAMYDIIPVKEKTSPKSRRKFLDDNVLTSDKYREVPPSPRTQRPRLNLQAQLYMEEDDDDLHVGKQTRRTLQRKSSIQNLSDDHSDISSEAFIQNRNGKGIRKSQVTNTTKFYIQDGLETISSSRQPIVTNEIANNDTTFNTQTTGISEDKTDKTLSEIKDILQSFLLELKKESPQNEKLNVPPPNVQKNVDTPQLDNRNAAPNFGYGCDNNSFGQCAPPLRQSFTNPCCYPVLTICPMNCIQNGFMLPRPSCSCAELASNSKNRRCGNDSKNETNASDATSTETQKLIKEIHKLISQNPNTVHKEYSSNVNDSAALKNCTATKVLVSRSVGGSSKASKRDAKIGTKMDCHSKSCEAIGCRLNTHKYCAANMSYSDTMLERGSSEEVIDALSSESEYSSESIVADKKKESKFSKMLKSIRLLKKNKTKALEKPCISDSEIRNKRPKTRSPFEQHKHNYNMYGEEYYQPPSIPMYPTPRHQYEYCNHLGTCYSSPCHYEMKNCHGRCSPKHGIRSQCMFPHTPIPHYCHPYSNVPQVPLCLKEIEVKSIGTQSIIKMSFLQKLTKKMQVQAPKPKKSSEIHNSNVTTRDKVENNIFDWKKWQAKSENKTNKDPLKFSYTTQKQLAEGDIKMRDAVLKKLFYKRNPFSRRNLLMRTLLGKDKSSFGLPPKMYKPRMFL